MKNKTANRVLDPNQNQIMKKSRKVIQMVVCILCVMMLVMALTGCGSGGEPTTIAKKTQANTPAVATEACILIDPEISIGPDIFENIEFQNDILDYLNAGGDPLELSQYLASDASVQEPNLIAVYQPDFNSDQIPDVLLTISLPYGGGYGESHVYAFLCRNGQYETHTLFRRAGAGIQAEGLYAGGGAQIERLDDLNKSGNIEILFSVNWPRYADYFLITWEDDQFHSLISYVDELGFQRSYFEVIHGNFNIDDVNGDGIAELLVVDINSQTKEIETWYWDGEGYRLLVVETPTPSIPSVLPSPTTESLIPNNLGEITVDNIQDLEVFGEIPYSQVQPDHNIFLMNLSNEGTKLVVISENWDTRKRALVVWDLITNSQMMEIIDPPYLLWWASFSPDDHQLWVLREDFIDEYNLEQGELVNTIDFPKYDRGAAAISPDGKYIVTGIYHGDTQTSSIRFYHYGIEEPFFSEEMAYMIMSFRFSPDSRMVAGTSATMGASATKIWDIESGTLFKDFYNYDSGPVFSLNSKLAAFVKRGNISIFSTDSWVFQSSFQKGTPSSSNFPRFFLGKDQILAISESYHATTFNNVNTGDELFALPVQAELINISSAQNLIITSWNLGSIKNIKLWGIFQ